MQSVLHVGKFYPPVQGGMERVVETLCRCSTGLVESRVLVANTTGRTMMEQVDGVSITRIATVGAVGSVHIAPSFAAHLRRMTEDAIVLHEPNPWALLSYALARPRAPLVIWYHSDVVRSALQYALFYAPMARFVYSRARLIIVSSPALAAHAKPLEPYAERIRVVPFGIEPATWNEPPAAANRVAPGMQRPYVLFAGRHVPYKGVDVLLRAIAVEPSLRAVIVGDGPRRCAWETLARELNLCDRACFTGEVSDADLKVLMHGCAALVLPSVTRAEAFGYVQLEAMAAGVPVISTDVPSGVSWVNQHERTGIIVPAGNAEALRDAIARLVADPILRGRLGAAGRDRVRTQFTLERLRERLGGVYEELGLLQPFPAAC